MQTQTEIFQAALREAYTKQFNLLTVEGQVEWGQKLHLQKCQKPHNIACNDEASLKCIEPTLHRAKCRGNCRQKKCLAGLPPCPIRVVQLAAPSKRLCLDTWITMSSVLPPQMSDRLRSYVLHQTPIVRLAQAADVFHSKKLKKTVKRSTKTKHPTVKCTIELCSFCVKFAHDVAQQFKHPFHVDLEDGSLKNLSKTVFREVAMISKPNKTLRKNRKFSKDMQVEISNKVTIWIFNVLKQAYHTMMEEDLRELEEEEGPVLDFLDETMNKVMSIFDKEDNNYDEGAGDHDKETSFTEKGESVMESRKTEDVEYTSKDSVKLLEIAKNNISEQEIIVQSIFSDVFDTVTDVKKLKGTSDSGKHISFTENSEYLQISDGISVESNNQKNTYILEELDKPLDTANYKVLVVREALSEIINKAIGSESKSADQIHNPNYNSEEFMTKDTDIFAKMQESDDTELSPNDKTAKTRFHIEPSKPNPSPSTPYKDNNSTDKAKDDLKTELNEVLINIKSTDDKLTDNRMSDAITIEIERIIANAIKICEEKADIRTNISHNQQNDGHQDEYILTGQVSASVTADVADVVLQTEFQSNNQLDTDKYRDHSIQNASNLVDDMDIFRKVTFSNENIFTEQNMTGTIQKLEQIFQERPSLEDISERIGEKYIEEKLLLDTSLSYGTIHKKSQEPVLSEPKKSHKKNGNVVTKPFNDDIDNIKSDEYHLPANIKNSQDYIESEAAPNSSAEVFPSTKKAFDVKDSKQDIELLIKNTNLKIKEKQKQILDKIKIYAKMGITDNPVDILLMHSNSRTGHKMNYCVDLKTAPAWALRSLSAHQQNIPSSNRNEISAKDLDVQGTEPRNRRQVDSVHQTKDTELHYCKSISGNKPTNKSAIMLKDFDKWHARIHQSITATNIFMKRNDEIEDATASCSYQVLPADKERQSSKTICQKTPGASSCNCQHQGKYF